MKEFKNTRNPILPLDIHIPDSEGHVMPNGKLYLYGSYDDRETEYCSEKYYVVSTPDMEHWTIHNQSMEGKDVPWFNNPDAPIMGYQACGLKGSIFIGVDEGELYGEKLKNISDGDEAVFRYVRNNCAYTGIEIRAAGSGRIHVLMNGKNVGTVDIENGQQKNSELSADAGEYELTFRFEAVEDLEVMEIVLHSGREQ